MALVNLRNQRVLGLDMAEIVHKELSYQVRGVLFDVYNQLGPNLPEQFYQSAVAIGLEGQGIVCETEKLFEVRYQGVQVGRYYVDVWLEQGKLLLELKVQPHILPLHRAQALSYLKVTDADLAVVVNFGEGSLVDERLPNYFRDKQPIFAWQNQYINLDTPNPELTNTLLQALYRVHFELGPGFLHQIYRRATMIELRHQGIGYEYLKKLPVYYGETHLGDQDVRLIKVDKEILLATVAVKKVDEQMKTELRSRLKQLQMPFSILANFNGQELDITIVRTGDKKIR
jgi:GxxExxY protein